MHRSRICGNCRSTSSRSIAASPRRSTGSDDDLVLLKGIVDLGNALGLTLVAEGIETEHQRRIVGELGCHGAQGFYFGRPTPVPALSTLMSI